MKHESVARGDATDGALTTILASAAALVAQYPQVLLVLAA